MLISRFFCICIWWYALPTLMRDLDSDRGYLRPRTPTTIKMSHHYRSHYHYYSSSSSSSSSIVTPRITPATLFACSQPPTPTLTTHSLSPWHQLASRPVNPTSTAIGDTISHPAILIFFASSDGRKHLEWKLIYKVSGTRKERHKGPVT